MSFISIRHFQLWIIFTIPLMAQAFMALFQLAKKRKGGVRRFWIVYRCFLAFSFFVAMLSAPYIYKLSINDRETTFYPVAAITFLRMHPSSGHVFSLYNWGGYLIWHLPDQKVFVDGRMPIWSQTTLPSESTNAFAEYLALLNGKESLAGAVQKYHIAAFLLPSTTTVTLHPPSTQFYAQLQKLPFKKTYEDDVATVYMLKK